MLHAAISAILHTDPGSTPDNCLMCLQGLGKTLQTISLVAYLHEYRGIKGPHIVIVPKSTLGNWMNEFRRFCPVIRCIKFHGNAEERVSIWGKAAQEASAGHQQLLLVVGAAGSWVGVSVYSCG
jgi:SNF2 family DNA or RNA helicase